MDFQAASVSDLVNSIKSLLEDQYQEVFVQGEITNLSLSSSGHWYFNLSDEGAAISCALFKMDALRNPLVKNLKDGDKIIVLGPLSVYQKRGTFQILAKKILPAGTGQLKIQFERLKAKLSAEGLFDIDKKKGIPKFPERIAVITAEHGAALQDFLNVFKRRSLWCDILILPALVQGEGSAKSLKQALLKAQNVSGVDVIVLTRGGGSLEDLWSFNDEELIRTIAACTIPVVSAVGHEVDFTLSDFVADFRAETPTAAAEILSQPQTELNSRLLYCVSHLKAGMLKFLQQVDLMNHRFHPREMIHLLNEKIQFAHKKIESLRMIDRAHELIGIHENTRIVDELGLKLTFTSNVMVATYSEKLKRINQVLMALDPKNVLKRGFTYTETENHEVISTKKDFNKLPSKTNIKLHFHDGVAIVFKE